MQKEELDNIIKALEDRNSNSEPGLGFYYLGNDRDETYAKGNRAGLELFAVELLKASSRIDQMESGEIETLFVNVNKDWIENHIPLCYIEPVVNFERVEVDEHTTDWKDTVLKYGCFAIILLALFAFIIGMGTIIGWFK
ncbi:hypothetical protein [Flavobacterium wongokense]|uniref:hypothetical protein n=1 Tax=Flavobacterium wongokense TaxID=2910674 RepID=UPI001F399D51|nr:hypothetical protein [Flavobacterium sp. WG47]MCF6131765.1 hypothetical protein [Flavobacterium sp. WG47]